jgi:hypothetical protein
MIDTESENLDTFAAWVGGDGEILELFAYNDEF